MSELKSLMSKIIETKRLAKTNADDALNAHVRRALMGNIKRAKEDLNTLFEEYRNLVKLNCAFILVTGSQSDKFAEIARDEFQCFELTGNSFYEDLISEISPRMYENQTSGPALFDMVGTAFENIALNMGIIGYPPLIFEQQFKKMLTNKEQMLNIIRDAFNKKIGSEVVGYYALDKVAYQAIDCEFEGKIVPIIVHSKDIDLIKEFAIKFRTLTKDVFIVSTGVGIKKDVKDNSISYIKSVDSAKVEETLKSIREKL